MKKILTFIKENNNWYINLPNWIGPKSALLMVGGAHNILDELSAKCGSKVLKLGINTEKVSSPFFLERKDYTITRGANYTFNNCKDVWLCPVTLFIFGKYPKYISFGYAED